MIATTRAAITEPMIHLFLLILLDMAVRIFLLLLILSSTPWSCVQQNTIIIEFDKNLTRAKLVVVAEKS